MKQRNKKGGRYASSSRSHWGMLAAAACLFLALGVGGKLLLRAPAQAYMESSATGETVLSEPTTAVPGDYSVATDLPAAEVETFAQTVRQQILEGNWKGLADLAQYPLWVDGTQLLRPEDFLTLAQSSTTDPAFVTAMEEEDCNQMFCNWQGISMGSQGQLWFSGIHSGDGTVTLKITAINGAFRASQDSSGADRQRLAALVEILLGDGAFYSSEYKKDVTIGEYCAAFTEVSGAALEPTRFAVADLNEDGAEEVILWLAANEYDDYGTLVLHSQDGLVLGHSFAYRQLFDLKQDGTFHYSGSASEGGTAQLEFSGQGWNYKMVQSQDQVSKPAAVWHFYPCQWPDAVLNSYEKSARVRDEKGKTLFDTLFLPVICRTGPDSWEEMESLIQQSGFVYTQGEGMYDIYDPNHPGTWLSVLPGLEGLAELQYYTADQDQERWVTVQLEEGAPKYYIGTSRFEKGRSVDTPEALIQWIRPEGEN